VLHQAVRIPVEFEMPGTEVTIRKEGDKLVLEPNVAPKTFAELFSQMETIDIEFPDVDEGLLPLRDIVL
jgi:antitoxin VapB